VCKSGECPACSAKAWLTRSARKQTRSHNIVFTRTFSLVLAGYVDVGVPVRTLGQMRLACGLQKARNVAGFASEMCKDMNMFVSCHGYLCICLAPSLLSAGSPHESKAVHPFLNLTSSRGTYATRGKHGPLLKIEAYMLAWVNCPCNKSLRSNGPGRVMRVAVHQLVPP
jgi:hypothetical protein